MLPTKFKIKKPFDSGEEAKNRFSRWPPWQTSWISDQKDFRYFSPISQLDASYLGPNIRSEFLPSFESTGFFNLGEEAKMDFQDGLKGSHLGFPIGTILAIFNLQIITMLPTKFRVNWSFSSEEEAKNRFSRWPPWRRSWTFDRDDFCYFWSISHPNASYHVWSQLAFGFRRRSEK